MDVRSPNQLPRSPLQQSHSFAKDRCNAEKRITLADSENLRQEYCTMNSWVPSVGTAYATSDPQADTGRTLIATPNFKADVSWEKLPGTLTTS